jgi:hypothetical protein
MIKIVTMATQGLKRKFNIHSVLQNMDDFPEKWKLPSISLEHF